MIIERKQYYQEMINKDRLMPIIVGNRFAGLITFYLTNNEHEYDNIDSWAVVEDNPNGNKVCIRQMITDNHKDNKKLSFRTLGTFILFVKNKFPNAKYIFWRRWNKNSKIVKSYKKEI